MPTVLRNGPYRFFFYAGDRDEPPHIHIERDNNIAKFWLDLSGCKTAEGSVEQNLTAYRNWLMRIK